MIGCLKIFGYLTIGEIVARSSGIPLPGPMIGLGLMLIDFVMSGKLDADVESIFDSISKHFTVLFVSAGAGVLAHGALIGEGILAIAIAVLAGTLATASVTAALFRFLLLRKSPENHKESSSETTQSNHRG